jgi:phage terminase large subunit-like protein
VANCVVEKDPAGNIKLSKAKSTERIDMAVAAVMALARLDFHEAANDSNYSSLTVI